MSETTLRRILITVVGLVFLYGLVTIVGSLGEGDAGRAESELELLLQDLSPDGVDEILFITDDTVRLTPGEDGRWRVEEFRADSARIARMWNGLLESDAGEIVARNPENHAALGVDEESATRMLIRREAGTTAELLIGGSGPTYPSAYVRLAGSNDVHLLQSDLAATASQSVTTWRDHSVVRVDTSRVQVVESTIPGDAGYTIRRAPFGADGDTGGGWTVDGEPGNTAQVRNVVGGLARVLAADFVDPGSPRYDSVFPDPATVDRRMVALDAQGDTLTDLLFTGGGEVSAGGVTSQTFFVRTAGDSTVYEIAGFDVGRLFPDREGLLAGTGAGGGAGAGPGAP